MVISPSFHSYSHGRAQGSPGDRCEQTSPGASGTRIAAPAAAATAAAWSPGDGRMIDPVAGATTCR